MNEFRRLWSSRIASQIAMATGAVLLVILAFVNALRLPTQHSPDVDVRSTNAHVRASAKSEQAIHRVSQATTQLKLRNSISKLQQNQDEEPLPNVFLLAPTDVSRPLSLAERAIDDGDFASAANLLGSVLLNSTDEDYFLALEDQSETLTSVKRRALSMIRDLPDRGREVYELRYGIDAANQLRDAVQANDLGSIHRIAELYFYTEAGYDAMLLVGRDYFYRKRFLQAARCFSRINESCPPDSQLHFEASQLAAASYLLAERFEDARNQFDELLSIHRGRTIELGGERLSLIARTDSQREELFAQFSASFVANTDPHTPRNVERWTLFHGDTNHNGLSEGGLPLVTPLWRVPVLDADDEELASPLAKKFDTDQRAPIPAMHPLLVGDFVVMRTPFHLMGVHIESGKRSWIYPWDDSFFGRPTINGAISSISINDRTTQLQQRLWEDGIHGQITSDGELIFFVDGLGYATSSKMTAHEGTMSFHRVHGLSSRDTNHLVALRLIDDSGQMVEGKLEWQIGDVSGMDNPDLANCFFLGPPLPLDGLLYCLIETAGEIQLIVLDGQTGQTEWRQQLATSDEVGTVQLSGIRRLAGATPSYADGILLCPTAAGAIVAVDPTSHALLWGYQFPVRDRRRTSSFSSNQYQQEESYVGHRWTNGVLLVDEGRVLITPVETHELHCIDLKTGESIWESPRPRGDGLYVGGVENDIAMVVGSESIVGVSMDDGSLVWQLPLDAGKRPSGHGYRDGDSFYLPTVDRTIVQVAFADGEIRQVVECDRPLGNLVSARGRILSHGYDYLATYYQDLAARQEVEFRLANGAEDAFGLALRGQLELQSGQWQAAMDSLIASVQRNPSENTRSLLVMCLLKGLRDREPGSLEAATEYASIATDSDWREEFLQLHVESLLENGDSYQAFERLIQLVLEPTSLSESNFELQQVGHGGRFVRHQRWVQSVMSRVLLSVSDEQRTRIDDALLTIESQLISEQNPFAVYRYHELFGPMRNSPSIQMLVAQMAIEEEDWLRASLTLYQLVEQPDDSIAQQALAGLAICKANAGNSTAAIGYLNQLRTDSPDQTCWRDLTIAQLRDSIIRILRERDSEFDVSHVGGRFADWNQGTIGIEEGGDVIGHLSFPIDHFPITCIQDKSDNSFVFQLDHDRRNAGIFLDEFGREIAKLPLRASDGNVVGYFGSTMQSSTYLRLHDLVIVVSGYDIVGIDLTRLRQDPAAAIIWRYSMLPDVIPDPNRPTRQRVNSKDFTSLLGWHVKWAADSNWHRLGAVAPVTSDSFCLIDQNQLVCLDPLTGEIQWSRSGISPGSDCVGNEHAVAVIDRTYARSAVYRLSDGSLVDEAELPVGRNVLTTYRDSLLSFDSNGQEITLRLTNCITRDEVWNETYPPNTRATHARVGEFAILTPEGEFTVRSLLDGSIKFQQQLRENDSIESIVINDFHDNWLVIFNENDETVMNAGIGPEKSFVVNRSSPIGRLIHGEMYLMDAETGEPVWESPARIEQFCVPYRHPLNVPVLAMMRHHRARTDRGEAPFHTEVAVIDRRDGRLVLHRDEIPQATTQMTLLANPADQSARLSLDEKLFHFHFSTDPRAPAPPANTEFANLYPDLLEGTE